MIHIILPSNFNLKISWHSKNSINSIDQWEPYDGIRPIYRMVSDTVNTTNSIIRMLFC